MVRVKVLDELQDKSDMINLGHNFTGPTQECHYCGYEKDECLRYEFDCDSMQQLETRKAIHHIAKEVSLARKELNLVWKAIRNHS